MCLHRRLLMKTYNFKYGHGSVSLSLNEADILAELHGTETPPISDIRSALFASLEQPIDSAPLRQRVRPGDRVALVISDMTRFWMRKDLVIPHLVDYLIDECGVQPEHLTIVVANGTHIGGDEQELRTLVTDGVYNRVRVKNHDCEAKDLAYLGTTPHETPVWIDRTAAEADLVVCLGAATHHVMAGFGGGRKSILPGISGLETIRHNHAYSLDEQRIQGYDGGADSYISKPFNSQLLLSRVRNLIANRRQLRQFFGDNQTIEKETISDLDKGFVSRFKSLVEERMKDAELNVEDLGRNMGMSRVQLYRKLKSLTNYSPNELLRQMRLKKAASLLASSDMTVAEIAYEVGFSSPSYFTKCYKEQFGESPTEFLKRRG